MVVVFDSGYFGFFVLFWIELDVLFIQEVNDFDYWFMKENIVYKCGYDGYMVVMMGFVRVLYYYLLEKGWVLFFF